MIGEVGRHEESEGKEEEDCAILEEDDEKGWMGLDECGATGEQQEGMKEYGEGANGSAVQMGVSAGPPVRIRR